jgi:sulfatase maturation enzyme AslB (radical SAM superfamily)
VADKNVLTKEAKPRKTSGLYYEEFKGYRLVCNFSVGKSLVIGPAVGTIFDLCDGERTAEMIWEIMSLREKEERGFQQEIRMSLDEPFGNIISAYKNRKREISFHEVIDDINLLAQNGMIEGFPAEGRRPRTLSPLPLELECTPASKRLLPMGMTGGAVKKMEVSVFLDDIFLCDYAKYPDDMVAWRRDFTKEFIQSVFSFAKENDFGGIFFKIFAGKEESLQAAKEIFRASRKKVIEDFTEASFYIFSELDAVTPVWIREFGQMAAKLVLSLDGIKAAYERLPRKSGQKKSFKSVDRTLSLIIKKKIPLLVVVPVSETNLDQTGKIAKYLSSRKISFVFDFFGEIVSKKTQEAADVIAKVYDIIGVRNIRQSTISSLLGRNFSVSVSRANWPHIVYYQKKDSLSKEIFQPQKGPVLETCRLCPLLELCARSFPARVDYFSQKKDGMDKYCSFYKKIIPVLLRKELERVVLNKWKN